MHKQDKELQIKLAKLQANVQIYITAAFGFAAAFLALIVCLLQIFLILPLEVGFAARVSLLILMIILVVGFGCFTCYFIVKAIKVRDEIEELKKEYCW